jgi:hypothetical protein
MMTIKEGILFHQVNCHGVMGAGIARAFADKYPGLEKAYQDFCEKHSVWSFGKLSTESLLGRIFLFEVVPSKLYIANIFGQDGFARSSRQTSYDATVEAFESLQTKAKPFISSLPLYFPYKMGCGLGGGDWYIYSAILERYFPTATICKHMAT